MAAELPEMIAGACVKSTVATVMGVRWQSIVTSGEEGASKLGVLTAAELSATDVAEGLPSAAITRAVVASITSALTFTAVAAMLSPIATIHIVACITTDTLLPITIIPRFTRGVITRGPRSEEHTSELQS